MSSRAAAGAADIRPTDRSSVSPRRDREATACKVRGKKAKNIEV